VFSPGDIVICIRKHHKYHAAEPILGKKYIVQKVNTTNDPLSIYLEGEHYDYASECFVYSNRLTKLEKLIYGVANE
jgi:hypothetical protein